MKSFKQHISESLLNELKIPEGGIAAFRGLDIKFLRSVISFPEPKIPFSYFQSLDKKKEIQFLFKMGMFPGIDHNTLAMKSLSNSNLNSINAEILKLKESNKFSSLYNYSTKTGGGIGPGEVLLYYLLDNAYLAGTNTSGDVILGGKGYEVKGTKLSRENKYYGIQIGGTLKSNVEAKFISDVKKLYTKTYNRKAPDTLSATALRKLKSEASKDYEKIRKKFAQGAYEGYFSSHPIICVNNNKGKQKGTILSVKSFPVSEIDVYRTMDRGLDYLLG